MSDKNDIDWTDDKKDFLRDCWNRGDSCSEIERACSVRFREVVTKNAVVGKVHRLARVDPDAWATRPSPIRRCAGQTPRAAVPAPAPRPRARTLPALPSLAPPSPFVDHPPPQWPTTPAPPPQAQPPAPQIVCRGPADTVTRRRDGSGCLFPIGNPGTAAFRFCDDDLYHPSKPYCGEHAKLAYTKVRDRKADAHQESHGLDDD